MEAGDLKIIPYGPIELSPTAKVLHYGQEIFEGLKAYRVDGEGPFYFVTAKMRSDLIILREQWLCRRFQKSIL